MKDDFDKSKEILIKYGQEHLLSFYDELDDEHQSILLNQINNIDFDNITNLYKKSFVENTILEDEISPLPYIDKEHLSKKEKKYYEKIGIEAIKNNEFAVITLAGGQGTRLRSPWSKRYFRT